MAPSNFFNENIECLWNRFTKKVSLPRNPKPVHQHPWMCDRSSPAWPGWFPGAWWRPACRLGCLAATRQFRHKGLNWFELLLNLKKRVFLDLAFHRPRNLWSPLLRRFRFWRLWTWPWFTGGFIKVNPLPVLHRPQDAVLWRFAQCPKVANHPENHSETEFLLALFSAAWFFQNSFDPLWALTLCCVFWRILIMSFIHWNKLRHQKTTWPLQLCIFTVTAWGTASWRWCRRLSSPLLSRFGWFKLRLWFWSYIATQHWDKERERERQWAVEKQRATMSSCIESKLDAFLGGEVVDSWCSISNSNRLALWLHLATLGKGLKAKTVRAHVHVIQWLSSVQLVIHVWWLQPVMWHPSCSYDGFLQYHLVT